MFRDSLQEPYARADSYTPVAGMARVRRVFTLTDMPRKFGAEGEPGTPGAVVGTPVGVAGCSAAPFAPPDGESGLELAMPDAGVVPVEVPRRLDSLGRCRL